MECNSQLNASKISSIKFKNNRILDQLIQPDNSVCFNKIKPEYLNSFMYHDHISKNVMSVSRENAFGTSLGRSRSIVRLSHPENYGAIKESFNLLKSTRKFHINSIQNKNYKMIKQSDRSIDGSQANSTLNNFSVLQKQTLEKYLKNKHQSRQKYKEQKKHLSKMLQTSISPQPEKQPIEAVADTEDSNKNRLSVPLPTNSKKFDTRTHNKQNSRLGLQRMKKSPRFMRFQGKHVAKSSLDLDSDFYEEAEKEIIKDTTYEFKYLIRKNAQFLVTPDLNKRLIIKNTKKDQSQMSLNCSLSQNPQYYNDSDLHQYCFKANQEPCPPLQSSTPTPKMPTSEKQKLQHKIIREIEIGNYFRVEIELSVNPFLLFAREKKNNNNLLHICVMNNREDIFQMILRKCRDEDVDLVSQKNKYGRTPLDLGKILSFFKKKDLQQLMAKIDREKMKEIMRFHDKSIPNQPSLI